jgi:hypothetical protein
VSDLTRLRAVSSTASPTASTLVRVLASVVDLVVTDHDPVADEAAVGMAVRAAADALSGLADADPERTADALDVLVAVVESLPGNDPTLFDRWRQHVRALTPALATARNVVARMEAMVDEFNQLAERADGGGVPAPVHHGPAAPRGEAQAPGGDAPVRPVSDPVAGSHPAGPDDPGGSAAPGASGSLDDDPSDPDHPDPPRPPGPARHGGHGSNGVDAGPTCHRR